MHSAPCAGARRHLANLSLLDFMCKTGLKPSQLLAKLFEKVGPHFYDRMDFVIEQEQIAPILERLRKNLPKEIAGFRVEKTNLADGFKFTLNGGAWLLIRFSGTEPLVRIYSEASSKALVEQILKEGKKLVSL